MRKKKNVVPLPSFTEREIRMEQALEEIREIYAGMDGFIPETCPEGYQQRIIKQMYGAAVEGLKVSPHSKTHKEVRLKWWQKLHLKYLRWRAFRT